jgi:RNA polymerase sigma factor (sigma-70 family)
MGGGPVQELTDAELHHRIIDADEEAIAIWHDRTIGGVMKMLARKGLSPEDAEDVWNEACFETIARAGKLTPLGESLRPYVYQVAKNLSARLFQKRLATPTTSLDALEERTQGRGFGRGEVRKVAGTDRPSEPVLRLRDCLERAPEKDQLVAKLLMENASAAEIALVLEVSVDNAYQIKRRTLARLRECIEGANPWT